MASTRIDATETFPWASILLGVLHTTQISALGLRILPTFHSLRSAFYLPHSAFYQQPKPAPLSEDECGGI